MKQFVKSHWRKVLAAVLVAGAGYLATGQVDLSELFKAFAPSTQVQDQGDAGVK